jgi:hypothetical protein
MSITKAKKSFRVHIGCMTSQYKLIRVPLKADAWTPKTSLRVNNIFISLLGKLPFGNLTLDKLSRNNTSRIKQETYWNEGHRRNWRRQSRSGRPSCPATNCRGRDLAATSGKASQWPPPSKFRSSRPPLSRVSNFWWRKFLIFKGHFHSGKLHVH